MRDFCVDLVFECCLPFRPVDFRFVTMVEKRRNPTVDPAAAGRQSSFPRGGVNDPEQSRSCLAPKVQHSTLAWGVAPGIQSTHEQKR